MAELFEVGRKNADGTVEVAKGAYTMEELVVSIVQQIRRGVSPVELSERIVVRPVGTQEWRQAMEVAEPRRIVDDMPVTPMQVRRSDPRLN